MTHGHEVLEMLQDKSYTVEDFLQAVKERFGADERFYNCHAQGLTAEQLLVFFLAKGKIVLENGYLTFSRACAHHEGGCCHDHQN